jgi:hypothetical protein
MVAEWSEEEEQVEVRKRIYDRFDVSQQDLQMIAGTPDYVVPRVKKVMDILRPSILAFWIDGPLPREDRLKCLRLLASDVIPALRAHGKALGIVDPFEREPGSRPLAKGARAERVDWVEEATT